MNLLYNHVRRYCIMTKDAQRTCGGCTACCVVYDVPPLQKPVHTPCRHLTERGCGIHWRRPLMCRAFSCLWLSGFGREDERPDTSGYVLTSYSDISGNLGVLHIACTKGCELEEREARELLERFKEAYELKEASASVSYADGRSFTVRSHNHSL